MTYKQGVKMFHEVTENKFCKGSGIDYWTAQLAWSEFTDNLCKSGEITQKQWSNWATPFKYEQRL